MKKLKDLIQKYEDFPKKGVLFRDILEILQEPDVFKELIFNMSSNEIIKKMLEGLFLVQLLLYRLQNQ